MTYNKRVALSPSILCRSLYEMVKLNAYAFYEWPFETKSNVMMMSQGFSNILFSLKNLSIQPK